MSVYQEEQDDCIPPCPSLVEARRNIMLIFDRLEKGDKLLAMIPDAADNAAAARAAAEQAREIIIAWQNVKGFGKTMTYIGTGLKWLTVFSAATAIILGTIAYLSRKLGIDRLVVGADVLPPGS